MVLLSCSGTGGGIYAKLANGVARHNCTRVSLPTIQWPATAPIEGLQRDNSIGPRKRVSSPPTPELSATVTLGLLHVCPYSGRSSRVNFPEVDWWLDGWITRNGLTSSTEPDMVWASALTGRLLPAARETSHLFSFEARRYLLSAWYQRDTGKYERRTCDPVEVFTLSLIL
jgi:hypothetical protein